MAQVIYHYGARPDIRDDRDLKKAYSQAQIPTSPTADLRKYVDHVYDQGSLGSCTANALCAAYGMDLKRQSLTISGEYHYFNPSRLFLYYNTRAYEGTTQHDTGATLRDAIKSMKRQGMCRESDWPYNVKEYRTKPQSRCYEAVTGNTLCQYERLAQDIDQFRACLDESCPFVFGFNVYQSFHDYSNQKSGLMPMPSYREKSREPIGKHAVMAIGYDDAKRRVIIQNSWGVGWGDKGCFYMPYEFISDSIMCFDFWKISFACEQGRPFPTDYKSFVVIGNGEAYGDDDDGHDLFSSECEEYCSDHNDYDAAPPYQVSNTCSCCRLQ
jgi:C1A family cysteine protease